MNEEECITAMRIRTPRQSRPQCSVRLGQWILDQLCRLQGETWSRSVESDWRAHLTANARVLDATDTWLVVEHGYAPIAASRRVARRSAVRPPWINDHCGGEGLKCPMLTPCRTESGRSPSCCRCWA